MVADVRKSKNVKMLQSEELADADDAFDDKEVVMNRRLKQQQTAAKQPLDGGKSTEAKKMEIEKMSKKLEEETLGQAQPDSDDENKQRLANMRDADKRRFNVNDILGDFDRDERGHPLIL